jgi:hypothetical protein
MPWTVGFSTIGHGVTWAVRFSAAIDVGHDGFGPDDVFLWAAGIAAIITVVVALIKPIRALSKLAKRNREFLEDWFGQPANNSRGEEAIPGVMVRLKHLEANHAISKSAVNSLRRAVIELRKHMVLLHTDSAAVAKQVVIESKDEEAANRTRQEKIFDKLNEALDTAPKDKDDDSPDDSG